MVEHEAIWYQISYPSKWKGGKSGLVWCKTYFSWSSLHSLWNVTNDNSSSWEFSVWSIPVECASLFLLWLECFLLLFRSEIGPVAKCWKGLPEVGWSPYAWRYFRDGWMWHWGPCSSDGTQQVRSMVGLDGLEGLFQSKCFYTWPLCHTVLYEVLGVWQISLLCAQTESLCVNNYVLHLTVTQRAFHYSICSIIWKLKSHCEGDRLAGCNFAHGAPSVEAEGALGRQKPPAPCGRSSSLRRRPRSSAARAGPSRPAPPALFWGRAPGASWRRAGVVRRGEERDRDRLRGRSCGEIPWNAPLRSA